MTLKNPVLKIVKKRIMTPQMAYYLVGGPESCVGPFGYSPGGSSLFVEVWRVSPSATPHHVWGGNTRVPDSTHGARVQRVQARPPPPRETASQGMRKGHQAETRSQRLLGKAVIMAVRLVRQMRIPALAHDFLHK